MFQKTQQITPVYAYRTVTLDRRGIVRIPYHEFPNQAAVSDPRFSPADIVAVVEITGQTAAYVLDTAADQIYTRTRDVVMRGLQGQLTEQEQADVSGIVELGAAVAGAEHLD